MGRIQWTDSNRLQMYSSRRLFKLQCTALELGPKLRIECIPTELNGYCSDGGKVNIGDEGVLATVACCECGSGSTNNPVAHGAITVVPSNSGRAESCELHGTWDADDETCACSGNYIGELCFTECPCGIHGEQLDIAAAREADSCDAGSCSCEQGYFGEVCSSAGR